jgi:hypothetical protein
MSTITTTLAVNGQALLQAVGFDRRLAAALIATRPDWEQLLDSIVVFQERKNVAHVVFEIRQALGLEADHALELRSS